MLPVINETSFGSITVDGEGFTHDIYITLQGVVKKRKKKLSKAIYGNSHTISEKEIKFVHQKDSEGIIIGTGQRGVTELSDEAVSFLGKKKCRAVLCSTSEAAREWNRTE